MKKKTSIKDIAKAIGMSSAVVSYVLNGREKEVRISKETAELVRKTAKALNYQPNQLAKSLKSGKSFTIGLIVADISNPFFSNLARTIEDEAEKDNYTVIFGSSDESAEKSWKLINTLINRQVDGFIIAAAAGAEKQIQYLIERNIPFVLIDRYYPDMDTHYVITDNYQVSYDAVQHLIENGRQRIGFITYKTDLVHMDDRKRGYRDALKREHLEPDIYIKEVDFVKLISDVPEKMEELLGIKPAIDAIFFATNTLAVKGLGFLDKKGYKIPDEVAIISFDESEAFDFFYSPLSYIDQSIEEIGKGAVQLLLKQMNNKDSTMSKIVVPAKIVIRKSSGV